MDSPYLRVSLPQPNQGEEHQDTEPAGWARNVVVPVPITGAEVRLTYDWSRTTAEARDEFGGFPVVSK